MKKNIKKWKRIERAKEIKKIKFPRHTNDIIEITPTLYFFISIQLTNKKIKIKIKIKVHKIKTKNLYTR